jgi:hypothetical protein
MDSGPVQNVGIDHRGSDVLVAEQLLDSTNVIAILKQMRRETVPKSVAARRLSKPSGPDGNFHSVLEIFLRTWCRRVSRERGSSEGFAAGKRYCQVNSLAALGYLRSRANGR